MFTAVAPWTNGGAAPSSNQFTLLQGSATWDPPSLAASATTTTTVTVTGALVTDYALAAFSAMTGAFRLTATITAADTATVTLQNQSGGAINLGSGTVSVLVLRPTP